jgi:hypothetical protein
LEQEEAEEQAELDLLLAQEDMEVQQPQHILLGHLTLLAECQDLMQEEAEEELGMDKLLEMAEAAEQEME